MLQIFSDSELADLIKKVEAGERLDFTEGVRLMRSNDVLALGYMANLIRERKNGHHTYFVVTGPIKQAFADSLQKATNTAHEVRDKKISKTGFIDEPNLELSFESYVDILKRVNNTLPETRIPAFTAAEIDYFTQISGLSVTEVLQTLMQAGLGFLSEEPAEVFSPQIHAIIYGNNISVYRWLEIHEAAHKLGMKTCGSLMYAETLEDRVELLLQLRALQDRTGGFQVFDPFSYNRQNTRFEERMEAANTTGFGDLRLLATARILLDNIDHIKAFWMMLGPKLAQVSLAFGVDELAGMVVEDKVIHETGAETEQTLMKEAIIKIIRKAGREPLERKLSIVS